jgi:predicted transposase/invertase (TIGR01784 family)
MAMTKLRYTFKNDIVFKMYFVKHPERLKKLVALMLSIPPDSIADFRILNSEMPPEVIGSKFCHLDINMKVDGRLIDLEIQVNDQGDFGIRAFFYAGREFTTALKPGMTYRQIPPVIVISIIDFIRWSDDDVHNICHVSNDKTQEHMLEEVEWHYFELPKLADEIDLEDDLNIWLNIFDADTEEELDRLLGLGVPEVQQAIATYRDLTADEEFLRLVRMREDAERNETAALAYAEQRGEQKGIQIGEQKGKLEGKLEGRFEAAIDAVRNGVREPIVVAAIGGCSIERAIELIREHAPK